MEQAKEPISGESVYRLETHIIVVVVYRKVQRKLTLHSPGLVGVQHDVDHQGELGSTLAERLDESQHAEIMCQVNGVLRAFLFPPPNPEALTYGRDMPARRNVSVDS